MAQVRDPFVDLDKHLRQLEEHVDKLLIALDEWRQWKEDYETLSVDVKALPTTAAREDLAEAREGFVGELVKEKELLEIFGREDSKKRGQILSTLANRLDYVTKNIGTLEKQLETAENKLAAARVISNPEATDEEGLPITEIREELDEEDNVLSYSLRRPDDNQAQLLEALEKTGVTERPSANKASTPKSTNGLAKDVIISSDESKGMEEQQTSLKSSGPAPETNPVPKKKSVTFTEDTKPVKEEQPSDTTNNLEEILRRAKDQQSIISDPVFPADESPEDADLREDMIRYNKATMEYEMAPIVAELSLEEGHDDSDWDSDDYDEDDDDNEDQWGRTTSGVVDDDWKLQMLELKERLSQHTFEKQAKANDENEDDLVEGLGRISIKPEATPVPTDDKTALSDIPNETGNTAAATNGKKSVRFAPTLDIAENQAPPAVSEPARAPSPEVDPISDVVERKPGVSRAAPGATKKKSRFRAEKANRAPAAAQIAPVAPAVPEDSTRYAPSGPEGKTLASSVLEREPAEEAREPDEFDAGLLHRQATEEYFKMRNRLIHRQGGFMKEDENPIQPLDEEEGGPKRLSRFKAARLAKP